MKGIHNILTGRDNKTYEFARCLSAATWAIFNALTLYSIYNGDGFDGDQYAKSCMYIILGGAGGIALKSWSAPPNPSCSNEDISKE